MAHLNTNREYYSEEEALNNSITVGELIEELSHIHPMRKSSSPMMVVTPMDISIPMSSNIKCNQPE